MRRAHFYHLLQPSNLGDWTKLIVFKVASTDLISEDLMRNWTHLEKANSTKIPVFLIGVLSGDVMRGVDTYKQVDVVRTDRNKSWLVDKHSLVACFEMNEVKRRVTKA